MAVTHDGPSSTTRVYVDGQLVSSCHTGFNPSNIAVPVDLFIGRSMWSHDPYLSAELGCFRIYNRALRCVSCLYVCMELVLSPCRALISPVRCPIPQQRVGGGGGPLRGVPQGAHSSSHPFPDQGTSSSHCYSYIASDRDAPVNGASCMVRACDEAVCCWKSL